MSNWHIFRQDHQPHDGIKNLPPPPSWRQFDDAGKSPAKKRHRGENYKAQGREIDFVNAALYLRRPLLVTGNPGTGKTSLAYAVAYQLMLGEVLYWPITTKTTLKDGLYRYDAIGRVQENDGLQNIGKYIQLGPLGTALLPSEKPRILLIDEIDKGDIDLPNDLLHAFEEGRFEIPELVRIASEDAEPAMNRIRVRTAYTDTEEPDFEINKHYEVEKGTIHCTNFPFIIMTSNGERDFPPPFLRRCLRLDMKEPGKSDLEEIIRLHFKGEIQKKGSLVQQEMDELIRKFLDKRKAGDLATDQLLNAMYLITRKHTTGDKEELIKMVLKHLNYSGEDFSEIDPSEEE
jgi:MoxR-like ATPase